MSNPSAPQPRNLRFETIDDALAEAERLVAAEKQGELTRAGNWSLGKTLGHLATWTEFAHNGYPAAVHAPLPVRVILRMLRGQILNKGMMPGVKVGRVPGGTLGLDEVTPEQGLARWRTALQRLQASAPTIDNPAFGRLTHEEWVKLNLRHAELHLGNQVPA